jgi:hypothetical protein
MSKRSIIIITTYNVVVHVRSYYYVFVAVNMLVVSQERNITTFFVYIG